LKANTHKYFFDVGIYYNKFQEETLKTDVMPWILGQAENFVLDLTAMTKYPTICCAEYMTA
jgi:hypothetical protein